MNAFRQYCQGHPETQIDPNCLFGRSEAFRYRGNFRVNAEWRRSRGPSRARNLLLSSWIQVGICPASLVFSALPSGNQAWQVEIADL